jgi:hypothetical protein
LIGNELNHTQAGLTVEGGLNVKGDVFINGYSMGRQAGTYVDARPFGVSGVAAEDQTSALQAAIDGTRVVWNGAAAGTVFQKWTTSHAGNNSWWLLENINFRPGTDEPGTILDLTNSFIDFGCRLREVHFGGSSSDAVKMTSWINCHWEHIRFDSCGGYAVRLTPSSSQNLSSFCIDGFTYDHSRATSPGAGVFMIDNSADATNLGVFEIANGRIEVNNAWAAGNRAVVNLKNATVPTATRELGLALRNVTYSDASAMSDDVLLFRETANTTGSPSLLWSNVRVGSLSAVLGGNFNSALKTPLPVDLAGVGSLNVGSGAAVTVGTGARIFAGTSTPEAAVTAPIGSLFLRTDGGAVTTLYIKESGVAATGWVAK